MYIVTCCLKNQKSANIDHDYSKAVLTTCNAHLVVIVFARNDINFKHRITIVIINIFFKFYSNKLTWSKIHQKISTSSDYVFWKHTGVKVVSVGCVYMHCTPNYLSWPGKATHKALDCSTVTDIIVGTTVISWWYREQKVVDEYSRRLAVIGTITRVSFKYVRETLSVIINDNWH